MKLIIDVEKDYYEMIKYNVEHGQKYKPFDIIANAIPYEEKPQGEWINTSPYDDKGECSLCCYLSKKYYNFCPNCGAKMQKGGAE